VDAKYSREICGKPSSFSEISVGDCRHSIVKQDKTASSATPQNTACLLSLRYARDVFAFQWHI